MLSDATDRASPREGGAIARAWHGVTLAAVTDDYLAFLRARDRRLPCDPGQPRRVRDAPPGRTARALLTVSHWASWQAIEAFAGKDAGRARDYPEDAGFLLAFEPTVRHYLVEPAG